MLRFSIVCFGVGFGGVSPCVFADCFGSVWVLATCGFGCFPVLVLRAGLVFVLLQLLVVVCLLHSLACNDGVMKSTHTRVKRLMRD